MTNFYMKIGASLNLTRKIMGAIGIILLLPLQSTFAQDQDKMKKNDKEKKRNEKNRF